MKKYPIQKGRSTLGSIILVVVLAGIAYFLYGVAIKLGYVKTLPTKESIVQTPAAVQALIDQSQSIDVKRCIEDNKTYYLTDDVRIADEGNDVYDSSGVKVDSCFGFVTSDSISPFCKAFDTSTCTTVHEGVIETTQ